MERVDSEKYGSFFVDGPGRTCKTYLYKALLAKIRSRKMLAIATGTSGVAASIMPGGRTAHQRFKILIDVTESSTCNISKQSGTTELIRRAKLIIWDEAPMAKCCAIEALERTLRDIMGNELLFGGKILVFGGDFRQVLPVMPRGTRAETVNASLARSYLWAHMEKLELTTNMRATSDKHFSNFLLRIGDGSEPTINDDMVQIPDHMLIKHAHTTNPEDYLINDIFPSLKENFQSVEYITQRAILATKNESVDMLNGKLIATFSGKVWVYKSFDEAVDDNYGYYPQEFLNSLTPNGLPPHNLELKLNCPSMLLKNLDPSEGLCNGTRMVCRAFDQNVVHAKIISGHFFGKKMSYFQEFLFYLQKMNLSILSSNVHNYQ